MLQNLSSALVMIGALRVNFGLNFQLHQHFVNANKKAGSNVCNVAGKSVIIFRQSEITS